MRVFVFANCGHGTYATKFIKDYGAEVIGICGSALPSKLTTFKGKIARLIFRDGWPFHDPFIYHPEPSNLGLPFFDRADIPRVKEFLSHERPDLILVCGFPKLIPDSTLSLAPHAINIHPGLLPERPGGTPSRWAIRCGDDAAGVTAHYMTSRFDAGDIVWRKEIEFAKTADWGNVELLLTPLILEAVSFVVRRLKAGETLPRTPNPVTKSQPSLRGKHLVVDWTLAGTEIERLCRCTRPKTGALTTWRGKRMVLWSVTPSRYDGKGQPPGTIISIDDDGCPLVVAGDKSVSITQVLRKGKITDPDQINFRLGERLGQISPQK